MKQYVIAADIGTTSTKAVIINRSGIIIAEQSVGYPLNAPMPGRAEQDPSEIMQAVVSAVRTAVDASGIPQSEFLCMSMSSAMHSLIALDQSDELLTQCITWADNRSAPYVNILRERYDAQALYAATGTPIHPMSPLLKLMWMKEKDPAIFARARKFIGIKEYILNRWFGQHVIDESIASATGLYSLKERKWHPQSLEAAGITEDHLPELKPTTHVLEGMRPEWADRMGVPRDLPVVIGASDGVLANLGVGAVSRDSFAVTIGTSGAVRAVVDQPLTDPHGRTFCYSLMPNRWVVGGAINNGGVLFRWVRDELATKEADAARQSGRDPYDALTELAEQAPAGSGGLVVLPLFAGERAPYWNADVRGVFFGLSLSHGKAHMVRAVLEGIGYAVRSVAEAVEVAAGKPREIRAAGGFARSAFWRQSLADILGAPLTVPDAIESSALGAAALGMHALGEMPDLNAVTAWSQSSYTHQPNEAYQETYNELFALYKELYPRLVDPLRDIVAIQMKESK